MKTSPIHFINQVSLIAFVSSFQICNQILAAIFTLCAIMWKREVNKNIVTLLQLLTIWPILYVKSSNNYHSHREILGFTNLKTICKCVIGCWTYRQSSMNDRLCCVVLATVLAYSLIFNRRQRKKYLSDLKNNYIFEKITKN